MCNRQGHKSADWFRHSNTQNFHKTVDNQRKNQGISLLEAMTASSESVEPDEIENDETLNESNPTEDEFSPEINSFDDESEQSSSTEQESLTKKESMTNPFRDVSQNVDNTTTPSEMLMLLLKFVCKAVKKTNFCGFITNVICKLCLRLKNCSQHICFGRQLEISTHDEKSDSTHNNLRDEVLAIPKAVIPLTGFETLHNNLRDEVLAIPKAVIPLTGFET
ncbi:hypothetical protein QE152_g4208 [Popillia japonica]|uniref:Uncharacterized protein n=1 Tax=Popillia japonica TaxID=7064 RepID=A0AAW1N0Y5_POPJA